MTQRENTIQWRDPAEGLAVMPELSGLDFMTKIADGELPGAPIASHFPVTAGSGALICRGRVTKPGRRVAFAEGEVVDSQGKVVATASGSLLIFALPGR